MYQSNRSFNIPGIWASFPARGRGGNWVVFVYSATGHLITTHKGWGIWSLDSISRHASCWFLLVRGLVNHSGDKLWRFKDCGFEADLLKTKGLHKLCPALSSLKGPSRTGLRRKTALLHWLKSVAFPWMKWRFGLIIFRTRRKNRARAVQMAKLKEEQGRNKNDLNRNKHI